MRLESAILQTCVVAALVAVGLPKSSAHAEEQPAGDDPAGDAAAEEPMDDAGGDLAEAEGTAMENISLDELLSRESHAGQAGSFGAVLERSGARPYLHGIVSVVAGVFSEDGEFTDDSIQTEVNEFDVFIGAVLFDRIQPELKLEIGAEEVEQEIAQVDFIVNSRLIVRAGLFLTPVGFYNESFSPEYTNLLPREKITQVHTLLIPVEWSSLGLQARGRYPIADERFLTYSVFASSADKSEVEEEEDPGMPEEEEETAIRTGGRLGYSAPGVEAGVSVFNGPYRGEDERATLLVGDVSYRRDALIARTEFVFVSEDGDSQWGSNTRLGYGIRPWLRPSLGLEVYDLGDMQSGTNVQLAESLNFHPYHDKGGAVVIRLASYQRVLKSAENEFGFLAQAALGF